MNWVLIGLVITSASSYSSGEIGRYNTMVDCFVAREKMLIKLEAYKGTPPVNTQFVCIRTEYGD